MKLLLDVVYLTKLQKLLSLKLEIKLIIFIFNIFLLLIFTEKEK